MCTSLFSVFCASQFAEKCTLLIAGNIKASGLDEIEQGDYRPLNRQNGQKRTLDKSE